MPIFIPDIHFKTAALIENVLIETKKVAQCISLSTKIQTTIEYNSNLSYDNVTRIVRFSVRLLITSKRQLKANTEKSIGFYRWVLSYRELKGDCSSLIAAYSALRQLRSAWPVG